MADSQSQRSPEALSLELSSHRTGLSFHPTATATSSPTAMWRWSSSCATRPWSVATTRSGASTARRWGIQRPEEESAADGQPL